MSYTFRVVGKPSKYEDVVRAFTKLRAMQALEVDANGSEAGIVTAVRVKYGSKLKTSRRDNKLLMWKGASVEK